MHHFKEPHIKINQEWLQSKEEISRSKPLPISWPTTKFQKSIQIVVILLARIFRRKDASSFLYKWVLVIHHIISNGSILNFWKIVSSNLDSQLKKAQKDH
jgi:hypothetical protein